MLRPAVSVLTLVAAVFVFVACASESPPPPPTSDLQATVTAMVQDIPTQTPYPTYTALPTYTPAPTATLYPTYTPAPTAEPYPTYTPAPTATPEPTPSPTTPGQPTWQDSGNWYRDTDSEISLDAVFRDIAPGIEYDVRMATLDADPKSTWTDLSLTLGCLNDTPVGYLYPYTFVVPAGVDTYTVGIWDHTAGTFVDDLRDYPAILTDDGSGLYISNRAVLRGIVTLLEQATSGLPEGQRLVAGMWESSVDGGGLWADFKPAGSRDALRYLDCH